MKAGLYFYGLGTALTGMLDIAWGSFDASHQPIQSLGNNLPGQHVLAYVAGFCLIAAGLAILWERCARIGAAASAIAYLLFAASWLPRYASAIHVFGWRVDVLVAVSFGIAQQLMLASPAVLIYASTASSNSLPQKRAVTAARWMLGIPPVIFGLFHLVSIRVFASIVPHWMPFGYFWAALTGIAFLLSGCAICAGIKDVEAARLLALMLFLFEGFVEIPPIFVRLQNEATWSAAVYNITAIGACWIFAEFVVGITHSQQRGPSENVTLSRADSVVA